MTATPGQGTPPPGADDERSADRSRYPSRSITPWVYYDRAVYMFGEDGEDGVVVQGNDRRAWAALSAHARAECPPDRPGQGSFGGRVTPHWVTFRYACGCTEDQHAEHHAEQQVPTADYLRRRREGATIEDAASSALRVEARTCVEISGNDDCDLLPPCEPERMAWVWTQHENNVPESAVPVLEWSR